MARRLFNGNTFSENGWPYVDEAGCTWIEVPGTNVHLEIQTGPPVAIMGAFAADFNAYVEPLRDPDSACWTPGNSVATSNHPGATAMDLDWNTHRFGISYDGFSGDQIATCRELLDFYEDMIHWGQDWNGNPYDCMHWQMGYDTYDDDNDRPESKVANFIARKIRADGFSTFRRGNAPGPVAPPADAVNVLTRATGITVDKAVEILPTVLSGLRLSECTNANRIAMWLAQMGHESGSFVYTEEIASGDESTDRWLYKGRTWIQITWKTNYAQFSQWLFDKGLISSPTYFVDNPKQLAEEQWAGIGPAWYWTVARPQINGLCDNRDLYAVTQAINGGQNGADDRSNRYNRASSLGDQLLVLITDAPPITPPGPPPEGFLMALSDTEQQELLDKVRGLCAPAPSKSRYGDPAILWTPTQYEQNDDGFLFDLITEHDAALGDMAALGRIEKAAVAGDAIAQAFLEKMAAAQGTPPPVPAPAPSAPSPTPPDAPPPQEEKAALVVAPAPSTGTAPSVSSAIDNYTQQVATANGAFGQQMQQLKDALNRLIGG